MNSKPITDEELAGYVAFVYVITNLKTGQKYFGKKRLQFTRSKRIKNSRYRRKIVKKSDYEEYFGSSKTLHNDIEKYGKENFTREIIRLCKRLSEANYYELKFQMENDVLLNPNLYYNSYVGARISRSQLGISEYDS